MYNCLFCRVSLPTDETFEEHQQKHKNYDRKFCTLCSYATTTKTNFLNHYKTAHPDTVLTCEFKFCNYVVNNLELYRSHLYNSTHEDLDGNKFSIRKEFTCPKCNITMSLYKRKRHLQTKHKIDTGYKPGICKYENCISGATHGIFGTKNREFCGTHSPSKEHGYYNLLHKYCEDDCIERATWGILKYGILVLAILTFMNYVVNKTQQI
jgi:hypothetical protein